MPSIAMCRWSTFLVQQQNLSQGRHVLGPEHDPDLASNLAIAANWCCKVEVIQKALAVQEGQST